MDRMMHDLRGPLMPLQTAAYLLKHERGQLDPVRQDELVDVIQRQSQRLASMLEEFADWSRAQQGRLVGEFSPCSLPSLLDQAIGAVPGCRIDPGLDPRSADACLDGDEFRLVQALKTLVEYSHARDAAATLDVACEGSEVHLQLRDRGALLDQAQAASLLEQPLHTPRDEGLGLRLMVARSIVEGHGGRVQAVATPDSLRIECSLPLAVTGSGEP